MLEQQVNATHYTATFTGAANTDISNASVSVTAGSWQEGNGNAGAGGSTAAFTVDMTGTVIESSGSTSLVQVGSNYFLYPVGGSSGPELSFGGVPVVAGEFGAWAPIGAEQTASGYEIAWKVTDAYTVWNTDSNGNYLSNVIGAVSGSSYALESLEPSFHQDLNGDGQTGPPVTVVEAHGSTDLTEVGDHYFLYDSSGSGPSLKYAGTDYVAGEFGAWAPIGAEQTASGYEIYRHPRASQFLQLRRHGCGDDRPGRNRFRGHRLS
jgi:hypothetical protein